MTAAHVSVVVVSHRRPLDLARCLKALSQLYHPSYEVIVVADGDAISTLPGGVGAKTIIFDTPNIAAARNIGINAAAGDIIAFIDDDAVPEPTWLTHLVAPFADARVAASGGYVIGRNGFSLQWGALSFDTEGWDHPIEVTGDDPLVLATMPGGRAIRTQGTNMAFRRSSLTELGGFDENFHYFLEESELNLRIAQSGGLTAIVPKARVVHFTAASDRRRSDRVPLSLHQIGASMAVFHKKHMPPGQWARGREEMLVAQRGRLFNMLVDGRIEPRDVEKLVDSLLNGYDAGLGRPAWNGFEFSDERPEFKRFLKKPNAGPKVLSGWKAAAAKLRADARTLAKNGHIVTVLLLGRGARFHRLRYDPDGFWEQSGGIFGRADRQEPLIRRISFAARCEVETQRMARHRDPLT